MAETRDRIAINPDVMLGKAVIRGTRITVELILRKLGEGARHADLLEAYPGLTQADIQAALVYAADSLAQPYTRPTLDHPRWLRSEEETRSRQLRPTGVSDSAIRPSDQRRS